MQIRIVGGEEIFGRTNYISIDSPMAKALLGKSQDDEAVVKTPKGDRIWYVNKIAYKCPDWFTEQKIFDTYMQDDNSEDTSQLQEFSEEEEKEIEQEYLKTLVR